MNTTPRRAALVAIGLCLALVPRPALAAPEGVDCAAEPNDTVVGYGTVLNGPNCVITPGTDVDVIRFSGAAGEVVRVVASNVAGPGGLIVQVRDPLGDLLATFSNPIIGQGGNRWAYLTLQQSGSYGISVFEAGSDATAGYGIVVERVAAPGPDAVPLTIGVPLSDELNPVNDIDLFRFHAVAGSLIRVSIDAAPVFGQFAQLQPVRPSGVPYSNLEFSGGGPYFINVAVDTTGQQTVQVRAYQADMPPFAYTIRIDCISGPCTPPDCTLELNPTFGSGTLTIGFDLGNRLGSATWNLWLSVANQMYPLLSAPVPAIDPAVSFELPIPGLPALGTIAVVSSITTPTAGIVCMDVETVNTGAAAAAVTAADMQRLLRR